MLKRTIDSDDIKESNWKPFRIKTITKSNYMTILTEATLYSKHSSKILLRYNDSSILVVYTIVHDPPEVQLLHATYNTRAFLLW
jgi:hypothetical protein